MPIVARTVLLAALVFAAPAFAQNYPSRSITMIVPYGAGGSVDAIARIVSDRLGAKLGGTVVVENVAGAGGAIGTTRAARAEPDGYTLLFSVESSIVIQKLVSPSLVPIDPLKDFQPISMVGSSPLILLGRKDFPANTLAELMKLLKDNPGKYSYASSGVGTSLHLAGEMINSIGKVNMVHVPYKTGRADSDRPDGQPDRSRSAAAGHGDAECEGRQHQGLRHHRTGTLLDGQGHSEPGRISRLERRLGHGLVWPVRPGKDRSCDRRETPSGAGRGREGAGSRREAARGQHPAFGQFAEGIRGVSRRREREILGAGESLRHQGGIALLEPIPFEIRKRAIAAAQGRAPFDLLLRGARIADLATMEIRDADIGIVGPMIASVHAPGAFSEAKTTQDLAGLIIAPGFIDGHVHVESSHMLPHHYASVVVPQGTTTIFWDPHELANVLGLDGIRYAVEATPRSAAALHRAGLVLRAGGAGPGNFRRGFQGRRNPRIDVLAGCGGTGRSHGHARACWKCSRA